mgnify:CR=1 FL=1
MMGRRANPPMRQALFLAVLLLFMPLSGCLSDEKNGEEEGMNGPYPSVWDRHELDWNWSSSISYVLEPGPYEALAVQEATFEVDTSGVWETGPATSNVHLSYWLPSNTLEGESVPVIAVVSPYFSFGQPGSESGATNVVGAGRGDFIYENYVPHGYAFAQVSVFGTEESSGCFDYRGEGEGWGIHAAVEWLGQQNWSNGKVGLYGKSYEGATQWEAAALGSEYLATIVPISGTTGLHPLLYKNGSAEARSQVMHMNYFSSTVDYNEDDFDNICPDIIEGFFAGPVTYGVGELDPYMANYYDEREHISKALENYKGSVYWVQGMQDWNVDPHQVFPWYQTFIDEGFEVRGMLGQWEHNYPDQWTKHNNQDSGYGGEAIQNMTRWDWAQDLFEWFEYYLKGVGPQPELHAQIQRNDGEWRIESTWPPLDAEPLEQPLDACTQNGQRVAGASVAGGGAMSVTFECPALFADQDAHLSGLFRLHLDVTAAMDGGQIFAEMQDAETGLRLGHATMDIRYHQGGSDPTTVLPGQTLTMLMEFQAIDANLPAGHGIRLVLTETGEDYLAPACGLLCPVTVNGGMLTVDHIARDGSNMLLTPQGEDAANNQ